VVGCEKLRTGCKILTDIAARKSNDETNAGDIVSKHVAEPVKILLANCEAVDANEREERRQEVR